MNVSYMTYMATLYEIYNFGRPLPGNHYYTHSKFDQCLGVEKKIVKDMIHILLTRPSKRVPAPRVLKFKIGVGSYLVIITISLICLRRRKTLFLHFYPKIISSPPPWGGGS